jgi:hypothetical protein
VPVSTSGNTRPLQPPPGINLIDAICVAADQRERQQAAQPDMMAQMAQAMMTMQQMQTQMLQALTALVLRMEDKPKPKQAAPKAPKGKS